MDNIELKKDDYILVIDSGNGGKYTLKQLKKHMPYENFIFLEDDFNAPYGNKTIGKLKRICKKMLLFMVKNYPIKMIIFACNTLSTVCLSFAKNLIDYMPIIPTLPIIKTFKTNTLVLCTSVTKKYNEDVKYAQSLDNVKVEDFSNLAKKIDENMQNLSVLQPFLDKKLKKYADMDIHQVVLGCTHYNFIKKQITSALTNNPYVKPKREYELVRTNNASQTRVFRLKKRNIKFLEASNFVAKNSMQTLSALSLINISQEVGEVRFLKTSSLNIFSHK